MNRRFGVKSGAILAAVAALTILGAYLARLWTERKLEYGEPVRLLGNLFRLTLGENNGVAFGLFGGSPLVPWLSVLALAAFALFVARALPGSRAGGTALGLVLGGGVANLLDRLGDGRVTDYLDAGLGSWRWPTFNLPDVAITLGALLAVWLLMDSGRDADGLATKGRAPTSGREAP